jgi:hypothetical protein
MLLFQLLRVDNCLLYSFFCRTLAFMTVISIFKSFSRHTHKEILNNGWRSSAWFHLLIYKLRLNMAKNNWGLKFCRTFISKRLPRGVWTCQYWLPLRRSLILPIWWVVHTSGRYTAAPIMRCIRKIPICPLRSSTLHPIRIKTVVLSFSLTAQKVASWLSLVILDMGKR